MKPLGSGDDFIQFDDCGGTAYGDSGNDELIGSGDNRADLHGGSGNDRLEARSGGERLFGERGDDTLIGAQGETFFSCGPGRDTIINFNAAEGDTKTADCENF
jgi:Ca2+-binding RTX toxin-like protein